MYPKLALNCVGKIGFELLFLYLPMLHYRCETSCMDRLEVFHSVELRLSPEFKKSKRNILGCEV